MPTTAELEQIHQGKVIGWYAVQRVRMHDWLKPRRDTQPASDSAATAEQTATNISDTSNTSELEKASGEDSDGQHGKSSDKKAENKDKMSDEGNDKPSVNSKDAQKLKAVVRESHTILAKAHSVFPFQLFPDSVNIDRHKLTIVRRLFFRVEQKVSVPLENVKNIEADVGPFFGSITITSDLFINNTQKVHFLWRDDAKKIQKLVQGAVVAQGEGIDLNKIDVKQLRSMLIDLGSGHSRSM